MIRMLLKMLLATGASCAALSAAAQHGYPERPIRLLVGYSPGGSVDIVAREYAQRLGQLLHQSVVVENRDGASGTIAAQALVNAARDGYTLYFVASPTVTITPAIQTTPFDPLKDFQPVASVVSYTNVLLVNAQSPYRSVQDLATDAQAHPGKLTFGSAGVGSSNHLSGELLGQNAHIQLTHVPYKGNAPAQVDLTAGRITMLFDLNTTAKALVQGGQLKALAVTSGQRNPMFPDVPTMVESGYPNFVFDGWLGVLAPAGVPDSVTRTVAQATQKVLAEPAFREHMLAWGYTIIENTPDQLHTRIAQEGRQFRELADRVHLRQPQ